MLQLAFRNLYRDKLYTFLNLTGLAVSFACFLVIYLYLRSELTYDQHFEAHERIYRLISEMQVAGNQTQHAKVGNLVGPLLAQNNFQFEEFTRLYRMDGDGILIIQGDSQVYWDSDTIYGADNSIFDIFENRVIAGNRETALLEPRSLALSENLAKLLFGDADPIGKTLGIQTGANQYRVDLVFEELPGNTSHRYDMLFPFNDLGVTTESESFFQMGIMNFFAYTFFRLPANYDPARFEEISNDFYNRYISAGAQQMFSRQNLNLDFRLQPLDDVYLSPPLQEDVPKGNPTIIYALSAVSIFILGIASINYMNLSTARFAKRRKEVGVRRTLGAGQNQIFCQFLIEGMLLSLLALLIGVTLTQILFSTAIDSSLLGKDLSIFLGDNRSLFLQLFLVGIAIGLISGSYPAYYFSSVNPVEIFRPIVKISRFSITPRSILIGLQMLVTISVIAGAIAMYQQLNFMQNRPLGFEKENKLTVSVNTIANGSDYRTLITELTRHPDIHHVTMTDQIHGTPTNDQSVIMESDLGEEVSMLIDFYTVDENYLDTYSISLLAGRNFALGNKTTTDINVYPYLVNETLVNQMGWDDPIGREIVNPTEGITGEVIGVIADYNFSSLHEEIQPLALDFFYDDWRWQRYLVMEIDMENLQEILLYVESLMKTIAPETLFAYDFLDETIDTLYSSEQNQTRLTLVGAGVCIVIAILGLFGLSSFTIEQKTKEIGMRRVLGASVTQILAVMFKGVFVLIIASAIVASGLVFYALNIWLQGFAYRISISPMIFITATLLVLVISVLTLALQSIRVVRDTPVNALRYE